MQEVIGSIPFTSTNEFWKLQKAAECGFFIFRHSQCPQLM
jgi:hypothetical protein